MNKFGNFILGVANFEGKAVEMRKREEMRMRNSLVRDLLEKVGINLATSSVEEARAAISVLEEERATYRAEHPECGNARSNDFEMLYVYNFAISLIKEEIIKQAAESAPSNEMDGLSK